MTTVGTYLRQLWVVAQKDLTHVFRRFHMLMSMFVFATLLVVIISFALDPSPKMAREILPGVMWVSLFFAATIGFTESIRKEEVRGKLAGILLAPVDRSVLFYAKAIVNLIALLCVELIAIPLFFILLGVSFDVALGPFVLVVALGTTGLVLAGTFLAAMVVGAKLGDFFLPLLSLPLLVPVLLGTVQLTEVILSGGSLTQSSGWLQILSVYVIVFAILPALLFEYVLEV